MANWDLNFWDLPKPLRERIYRLALVQESPITFNDFEKLCNHEHTHPPNAMPCLMQISSNLEMEAMDIFLGENTFELSPRTLGFWRHWMPRRHINRVHKVLVSEWSIYGDGCDEFFRYLGSMRSLESLSVQIDEQSELRDHLMSVATLSGMKWHESLGYGPQVQLHVLHFHGIRGLRSLRGLRHVEFVPKSPDSKEDVPGDFGPMPGGMLNTTIKSEMMSPRNRRPYVRQGHFRFLELPPEIRTTIYNLLLVNAGITFPIAGVPTSVICASKHMRQADRESILIPDSTLSILATNRQIHNEAASIFYRRNELVFKYPAHLQAFTLSLENDRLASITSLILFYKDHNEGGVHTMDITLRLLRRMRGLKKFHLLMENHMMKGRWYLATIYDRLLGPAQIHGVQNLFSLRGLRDIKVRDLDMESRVKGVGKSPSTPGAKKVFRQAAALKHFNYGLSMTMQGEPVAEDLYTDKTWHFKELFPALKEGSECGEEKGCVCE